MKQYTKFEVGQQHRNRKGTYEVLAINGDTMHIRWEAGEEVTTSMTMQGRILDNMRLEMDLLALNKTAPPIKKINHSHGWHRV